MCLPLKPFRIEREWIHAGLKCAVTQNQEASNRCAYVRLPPGHPLYGKSYDAANEFADCHGGFTFGEKEPCEHEDGSGWWLGWDYAHCGDAMIDYHADREQLSDEGRKRVEAMARIHFESHLAVYGEVENIFTKEKFWTQAEVEKQAQTVAEQLADVDRIRAEIDGRELDDQEPREVRRAKFREMAAAFMAERKEQQ